MKKLYLVNYFNWSDSNYEATLNGKHVEDFDKKDYVALDFVHKNQYVFFFRSTYMILLDTVKLFNTLEELISYVIPLLYSGSLTEQNYTIGTIAQLLERKMFDI